MDIVGRLRSKSLIIECVYEAADEIERLRSENARLREEHLEHIGEYMRIIAWIRDRADESQKQRVSRWLG